MDILGSGVESNEENIFWVEGDAEFDSVDVSGSDSDCPEVMRRWMNPEQQVYGAWSW